MLSQNEDASNRKKFDKLIYLFLNGPNLASFCSFLLFSHDKNSKNLTLLDKSVEGVLGTRTQGGKMGNGGNPFYLANQLKTRTIFTELLVYTKWDSNSDGGRAR